MSSQIAPGDAEQGLAQPGRRLALAEGRHDVALYQGGAYGMQEESDEDVINLRDYWRVLVRRRWTVVTFFLIVVIATLIATFLATPIYRASLTLQIEREAAKVVQFEDVVPVEGSNQKDFYQTQYELLKSQNLAARVIDQLNLATSRVFRGDGESSLLADMIGGIKSLISGADETKKKDQGPDLEKLFLDNLTIEPVRNSRLVKLHYDSPDPRLAARITNAMAENYVSMNLERRFEANSYAKTFLQEQIRLVKSRLEESEESLVAFAREQEIIDIDEHQSVNMSTLQALNENLVEAEDQRIEAETNYLSVKNASGASIAQILDSPVIHRLKQTKAELQAEYQENLLIYKPAYPKMKQIDGQIAEVQGLVEQEANNIRSALRAKYQAALAKERAIAGKLTAMKDKVMQLQDNSVAYKVARREVDTNRQLYEGLLQRLKEVGVAGGVGTNNISVVDAAKVPRNKYKPSLSKNLLLAIVLGLFGGIGFAFLFEHLDDTIKGAEDLERRLRMAVLGIIPTVRAGRGQGQVDLPMMSHNEPKSALAEAYRSLRTALMFSTAQGAPKVMSFTSASASEGKTTSSINTATAFAQTGSKVLLVDADLRNPSLHKELGLSNATGLTNYLAGDAKPVEVAQATPVPRLFVIASGPLPPNPAELLASAKMVDLLSLAGEKFDYVVVDGPPVLGLADALIIANMVEGTNLVVEAGVTRQGALTGALKRLQSAQARVLGGVLTKVGQRGNAYGYDYAYSYNYYSYQSDDDSPKERLSAA